LKVIKTFLSFRREKRKSCAIFKNPLKKNDDNSQFFILIFHSIDIFFLIDYKKNGTGKISGVGIVKTYYLVKNEGVTKMRDQIWYNMLDCKFRSYYFEELLTKFQINDIRLNIFLTLTSSGGIASWVIWNKFAILWAIILSAATVLNVIKPYFPLNKYIKEINSKVMKLENLHLDFERLWFKSEYDDISEKERHEILMELKKRSIEILKFSDDIILKNYPKIEEEANESMKAYLKTNFNIIKR
jgi:hypothetical protein